MSSHVQPISPPSAQPAQALQRAKSDATLRERIELLRAAVAPTPLAKLELEGAEVFVKLECHGLVGSLKDRPALWILREAIRRGDVHTGSTVVESSSGNFAMALAAYCAWLGLDFIPVIDPNIAPFTEAGLRTFCPCVEVVHQKDDAGGYLKTRLARVQALCKELPHPFWTNQYANVDGALGHYNLTGAEICNQLSQLDFVFVGVSSAGTITGLSRRLKERFPGVKVIAVDSCGSTIFGGPPAKRFIPGIGASVAPSLLGQARIDDVIMVPELEAAEACRELFARHHLFAGGSTGAVYAAIKRFLRGHSGLVRPKILFLCADRGTAYLNTVYNDIWIRRLQVST